MEKPEKLKVSRGEENYTTNWCRRCDKYYCVECVEFQKVDFDVEVNVNEERPDLKPQMENWKGEDACIWCYNQLIDIAFPPTTDFSKES